MKDNLKKAWDVWEVKDNFFALQEENPSEYSQE